MNGHHTDTHSSRSCGHGRQYESGMVAAVTSSARPIALGQSPSVILPDMNRRTWILRGYLVMLAACGSNAALSLDASDGSFAVDGGDASAADKVGGEAEAGGDERMTAHQAISSMPRRSTLPLWTQPKMTGMTRRWWWTHGNVERTSLSFQPGAGFVRAHRWSMLVFQALRVSARRQGYSSSGRHAPSAKSFFGAGERIRRSAFTTKARWLALDCRTTRPPSATMNRLGC